MAKTSTDVAATIFTASWFKWVIIAILVMVFYKWLEKQMCD